MTKNTTTPVSPFTPQNMEPISDYAEFVKDRDSFYFEQMVRNQEISFIRDKLKWCRRREGVNAFKECRDLSLFYLELLSGKGIVAHKRI